MPILIDYRSYKRKMLYIFLQNRTLPYKNYFLWETHNNENLGR